MEKETIQKIPKEAFELYAAKIRTGAYDDYDGNRLAWLLIDCINQVGFMNITNKSCEKLYTKI